MALPTNEHVTFDVVITCRETGKIVDEQFAYGRTGADQLVEQLEDTWGERYIGSLIYPVTHRGS